jgi:hypothetical protein
MLGGSVDFDTNEVRRSTLDICNMLDERAVVATVKERLVYRK